MEKGPSDLSVLPNDIGRGQREGVGAGLFPIILRQVKELTIELLNFRGEFKKNSVLPSDLVVRVGEDLKFQFVFFGVREGFVR